MRIKVEYSPEVKRTGEHGVPGEFVIYTKKHFWNKWIPGKRGYADYNWACNDAQRMRMREREIPKYF